MRMGERKMEQKEVYEDIDDFIFAEQENHPSEK